MTRHERTVRVTIVVLAGLLVASGTASAQTETVSAESLGEPPRQPTFWEGGGVRLVEALIFHPRFELQTGYQSNVFYEHDETLGSGLMRISVGGTLESGTRTPGDAETSDGSRPAPKIAFKGDVNLVWNQYLSDHYAIQSHNDLGLGLLLDAKLNPEGVMTLHVREGFTRAVTPPPTRTADDVDRDKNELMVGVIWKPGGGAIHGYANYTFGLDMFERSDLDFADRLAHTFAVGSRWQWLPKTQFSAEASYGITDPGSTVLKSTSTPIRFWAGTSTLITPTFGTVIRLGYANALYDASGSNHTYTALLEARHAVGPMLRIAFGYSHDFVDALVGDFYMDHVLYGRALAQVGDRLQLRGKAEFRFRGYTGIPLEATVGGDTIQFCATESTCGTDSSRSDVLVRLDFSGEYQVNAWLYGGISYHLLVDETDFITRTMGYPDDPARFVWQEVILKATAKF